MRLYRYIVCFTVLAVGPVTAARPSESAQAEALKAREFQREQLRDRRMQPVETYVDQEGWQSGIGYRSMEHYLKRLARVCRERLPGMVVGIAGGKKGILLKVTFKAKRNFYLAQENTKELLTAIVKDLEKLPEPVAGQVIVTHNGQQIISAIRKGKEIKVDYLL